MRQNHARLHGMLAAQAGKVTRVTGLDGRGGHHWTCPDHVKPSRRTFDDLVDAGLLELSGSQEVGRWRFEKAVPTERGLAAVRSWLRPKRWEIPPGMELQV